MPHRSPFTLDLPATDVLSYVFPEGKKPLDKPIWIDADDTSNSLSPKQLLGWVKRLGVGLDKLGIQQNESIMMITRNHIFVPVLYLGVAGSGRVFTACNPTYGANEISFQLEDTGTRILLVDPKFLHTALEAAKKNGFQREQIYMFSDKQCEAREGVKDWRTILGSEAEARVWHWHRMSPRESETRVAVLNYSSGTTGRSKGVQISHRNIISNVKQSLYMHDLEQTYSPGYGPPERWLGFLPLYHCYGQLWLITAAVKNKTPCYYMRSFSFSKWLQHIQNHRITHIQTAPPLLVMLAKRPEIRNYDISSLVNILCGAAPLSKELQNKVSDRFKLTVCQTWGMTEVTCSCTHVPGGLDDRSGSVGYLDPNSEIKVVREDGREANPGEHGEIYVRGPNVCLGYHRDEEATKAAFDNEGFLRSGDIAVRDEHGWLWIVDRKKELIKVDGFQVPPCELEALLLEHEHIADAAVVGIQFGNEELPRAYVVLKDHAMGKLNELNVEEWVAKRVAKHKRLTGGVKFVEKVPKSPSGKIERVTMRAWAKYDAEEMSDKSPMVKL